MNHLIVPIFSMRSYKTGKYSVLKDGNFQLHLHRASEHDTICIPDNISDKDELLKLFSNHFNFVEMKYSENAYQTRHEFWKNNIDKIHEILSENPSLILISDITAFPGFHPTIYNFNISKNPVAGERTYIDEFFDLDLRSAQSAIKVFVLNSNQKDHFVKHGIDPNKIVVCQKVINPSIMKMYEELSNEITLDSENLNYIFHPFRLSDPCYQFDKVKRIAQLNNSKIYITDPNESFNDEAGIFYVKLDKLEYYGVLKSKPKIIYLENPEVVFHPGLAELIYFNCDIHSYFKMPKFKDVVLKNGENVWLS